MFLEIHQILRKQFRLQIYVTTMKFVTQFSYIFLARKNFMF